MIAVVASGGVSGLPQVAGNTWTFLQWMLGLTQLGVQTYWIDLQPRLDPRRPGARGRPRPYVDCHSIGYARAHFHDMARSFGFADRYGIVYDGGTATFGLTAADVEELAVTADLLLNLAGPLPADSPLLRIRHRAYVDLDPGFTQIWAGQLELGLERYHRCFTVGLNVCRPGFPIPTGGIAWEPTLPPVVLSLWTAHIDAECERVSTIGDWHGSQYAEHDGDLYSGKREEFLRFVALPAHSLRPLEPALALWPLDHEDLGLLTRNGWCVRDPYLYAGDLESYREFIRYSRAEFSVAKSGYVKSRCGWFSDRTACYLASGKPAVVQSTGLEAHLPTGQGLLTFTTLEGAAAALDAVERDYAEHCLAARRFAETHLDSERVLGSVLERAGADR